MSSQLTLSMSSLIYPFGSEVNRTPPIVTPPAQQAALPSAPNNELPLKTHAVNGQNQHKVLSPEQVHNLKGDVSQALAELKQTKKENRFKALAEETQEQPKQEASASAAKPKGKAKVPKERKPRGAAAREAAQRLLDSLATPAPSGAPEKGTGKRKLTFESEQGQDSRVSKKINTPKKKARAKTMKKARS